MAAADHLPSRPSDPGASARREATRLRERRQELRGTRTGLNRLIAPLTPSARERRLREEERSRLADADADGLLAGLLAKRCPELPVLHDRLDPATRRPIGHVALAPSGIYVIDCHPADGPVHVVRPRYGAPTLTICGRDQTSLLARLDEQVGHVADAVAGIGDQAPVRGVICLLTGGGSLVRLRSVAPPPSIAVAGHLLAHPRRLAQRLNGPGPLAYEQARGLHAALAEVLPGADATEHPPQEGADRTERPRRQPARRRVARPLARDASASSR